MFVDVVLVYKYKLYTCEQWTQWPGPKLPLAESTELNVKISSHVFLLGNLKISDERIWNRSVCGVEIMLAERRDQ